MCEKRRHLIKRWDPFPSTKPGTLKCGHGGGKTGYADGIPSLYETIEERSVENIACPCCVNDINTIRRESKFLIINEADTSLLAECHYCNFRTEP